MTMHPTRISFFTMGMHPFTLIFIVRSLLTTS